MIRVTKLTCATTLLSLGVFAQQDPEVVDVSPPEDLPTVLGMSNFSELVINQET
jgi:thiol-disulfide isomerase/thioredoxin